MSESLSATVRMYRLNELGDCFLLTFAKGTEKRRMLIDCGSFRNSAASKSRLEEIVGDIEAQLDGGALDVVVGTHQHNDHLSGFVHCQDAFEGMGVEQVWLSWLDDPRDRMARGIGETHRNLTRALVDARKHLQSTTMGVKGKRAIEILDDVLGFYGVSGALPAPELPAAAVEVLRSLGVRRPMYLRPGTVLDMPGLPEGSVRIHVLGPPRDSKLLYRKDPRTGESYDHALVASQLAASKFLEATKAHKGSASSEESQYPFSETFKKRSRTMSSTLKKLVATYRHKDEVWRAVDDAWLEQAEGLALFLDSFTNNTSLVLAIELVASGKVLLFAADAQIGNWLSWANVKWDRQGVSTKDLLGRTVLYKVGHHGSHNATLVEALETMTHPELVALIPVHKADPNITKPNGWKMPARNLFRTLVTKTSNRVLQMDGKNPPTCDPSREPAKSSWRSLDVKLRHEDLFVELTLHDR